MTGPNTEREAARVHWLIAGQFSPEPQGRSLQITSQEFGAALTKMMPKLRVSVSDRFGESDLREFELEVANLKTLTLGGIVQAVPQLKELLTLSNRSSLPDRDALLAEVERIVGAGRLSKACAAEFDADASPKPAASAVPSSPGADMVDAIFERAAQVPSATQAVSAFVNATSASKQGGTAKGAVAKKVRALFEAAIYGTAHAILRSDTVSKLESNWRGLYLLLSQCPPSAGIHVELLDVTHRGAVAALRDHPREESLDDPDAIFIVDPVETVALLTELAEVADETLTPCVTSVPPVLLGAADFEKVVAEYDQLAPEKKDPWTALRANEASRWLCLLANRVVLFTEGAGEYKRAVLASPAWALATMLSVSFKTQGAFARIVGQPGSYRGGATWMLQEGKDKGTSAPTECFFPIRMQSELAKLGIVGFGSPKNSDQLMLDGAPMASSVEGAWPLPGQILTGRIVRFSRWVRRQIGADATAKDVSVLFDQAAGIFLFPGMEKVARATGALGEVDGKRVLQVAADVVASLAGSRLHIEFALPL